MAQNGPVCFGTIRKKASVLLSIQLFQDSLGGVTLRGGLRRALYGLAAGRDDCLCGHTPVL
eukprot:6187259-Pleurochrysis_carterae.AAC.4